MDERSFFSFEDQGSIVDEEKGICTYWIKLGSGLEIRATSKCHQEDWDFFNQYTGIFIASQRCGIKLYKYQINYLKLQLRNLIDFRSKTLKRERHTINRLEQKIKETREEISILEKRKESLEKDLNVYIEGKNKMYRTLKEARKKEENNGIRETK